ncbi:hypothetical protein BDZ89DRAFT_1068979 [Hymenopellis radicata]|nr:hypothetical protein BDZ89DRAFT_1068979 [Hymenopellis radicata]
MGNSSSSAGGQNGHPDDWRPSRRTPLSELHSSASPSPIPAPFKRGRSLELPDIELNLAPREPIPIPTANRTDSRPERPRNRRQHSGNAWSPQRSTTSSPRSSYAQLQAPPPSVDNNPPPGFASIDEDESENEGYQQEVVRSTLPLPLAVTDSSDPSNDVIETPIVWNGDGTNVFLARAGDNDWQSLIPMHREGERFIVRLPLPRGTHHLRFVVDDQSRVADDMPKAVDDQGAFANYVSVGLSSPPPTASASPVITRNHSFWSSSSAGPNATVSAPEWTDVIPFELTEAAAEEEAFIANYNANATMHGRRQVITGFNLPNPNLPPAPQLPRHLEKQILNTGISTSMSSSSKEKRKSRHSHGHSHRRGTVSDRTTPEDEMPPSTHRVLPVTTASGTDIHAFAGMSMTSTVTSPSGDSIVVPNHDDDAVIADDNSVLPVPSHVVLNHLSTSSIRNGILAVANTARYKNKFLTTIYYKPT